MILLDINYISCSGQRDTQQFWSVTTNRC